MNSATVPVIILYVNRETRTIADDLYFCGICGHSRVFSAHCALLFNNCGAEASGEELATLSVCLFQIECVLS